MASNKQQGGWGGGGGNSFICIAGLILSTYHPDCWIHTEMHSGNARKGPAFPAVCFNLLVIG